ncbi:hypothetical protein [Actinoallomurus acanthiterrae]
MRGRPSRSDTVPGERSPAGVRDRAAPHQVLPAYDHGDHLHMNDAGYRAMADAADLSGRP